MSIPLKLAAPPAVLAAAALAAAGCGGSSNQASGSTSAGSGHTGAAMSQSAGYGSSVSSAPTASVAAAKGVKITTAHSKLGTYLVGAHRRAIYLFEKDKRGSGKSTCSGACAQAWPPVITKGKPKAGGGVKASKLSTLKRSDGTRQAVYNGWPLYFFAPDTAGTTRGQDVDAFGAKWYVMSPAGSKIGD